MSEARRLTCTPSALRLCSVDEIAEPGARRFVLDIGDGRFHGFVVRTAGTVRGYVDECPHMGLPLARTPDQYLTPNGAYLECGWHGAVFDPASGVCIAGPCARERLRPWPVGIEDGVVTTLGEAGG